MRNRVRLHLLSALVVALVVAATAADGAPPWGDEQNYVYAQTAHGFSFEGSTLVLDQVASTLYLADRSQRRFGQISNGDFARLWGKAFSKNKPYAVLSVLYATDEFVMVVDNPRIRGKRITWNATVVSGAPPEEGDACTLFLDPTRKAQTATAVNPNDNEPINDRDREARATIAAFKRKDSALARHFDTAAGWAVFPTIVKAGLIIGGAGGDGVVYEADEVIGYASLSQGSIGFQIGGQGYSEIIFFEDEASLKHFTKSQLEFSGQASAVVAAEGASANAGYANGVMIVTMVKGGLMDEASIGGQKFKFTPK